MLLRSAELIHASEKFDFTTKEFGADKEIRSQELRRLCGGGQSDGSLKLASINFLLFWETHDLVSEIISVSEKRMKNYIVKIIDNVFENMTNVVYFL